MQRSLQNSNNNFTYAKTFSLLDNQPVQNFKIADLNGDNKFDIVSYYDGNNPEVDESFSIYQQVNDDKFKEIYKDTEIKWYKNVNKINL